MRPLDSGDAPMSDAAIKAMKEKKNKSEFGIKEKSIVEANKIMGTFLVKIGLALQLWWKKLMCKWNWLVSKLIVNVA